MIVGQKLRKRLARFITCICLLIRLSVCCTGCGIGRPPVMTLEQWQAQDDRVRVMPFSTWWSHLEVGEIVRQHIHAPHDLVLIHGSL